MARNLLAHRRREPYCALPTMGAGRKPLRGWAMRDGAICGRATDNQGRLLQKEDPASKGKSDTGS